MFLGKRRAGLLHPQPDPTAGGGALSAPESKLQPFIRCVNRVDHSIARTVTVYRAFFRQVAADPGKDRYPAGFWQFRIEPYETDNGFSRDCIAGLRRAVAQSPADPVLDPLGADYASTLESLIPLMNEADRYYQQKDYRDDHLARGRALDARLSPLLDRLAADSRRMRQAIDAEQDGFATRRLAAIEKAHGRDFAWQQENVMLQSSRALRRIEAAAGAGRLDEATMVAAEAPLQQACDDARAYGDAHRDAKTRLGNEPMWFQLQPAVEAYLASVKRLRRDVAAGRRSAWQGDGDAVLASYNGLVDDYNLRAKFD